MSYNVRVLRDDAPAVVRVVRDCAPDVLCVQEAPRFARWRTRRAELARRCGLYVAAGARVAGLAILTGARVRVLHTEHHPLSAVPRLHRRAVTLAVLGFPDRDPLIVADTHLDVDPHARSRHAAELGVLLARARARHRAPLVLAGDLNEQPGEPAWQRLGADLLDAYPRAPVGDGRTYPARAPRRRIDAIFVSESIRVRAVWVPDQPTVDLCGASDHRPVVADLADGPPPGMG